MFKGTSLKIPSYKCPSSRKPPTSAVLKAWTQNHQHQYHPGTPYKYKFSGPISPTPDLNQKPWGWYQQSVFEQALQVILIHATVTGNCQHLKQDVIPWIQVCWGDNLSQIPTCFLGTYIIQSMRQDL